MSNLGKRLSNDFWEKEIACRHCGLLQLHPGFILELQEARTEFGQGMTIRSGCRCRWYNDTPTKDGGVGGHPRSLHVCDDPHWKINGQEGTLAVDVEAIDGAYRGHLFHVLWGRGWSIGWGRGFLHADRRDWIGLPQNSFDYGA